MQRPFKLPHRPRVIFAHINEFLLKEKLGSGGFSTVYKAFHKTSRKMYAIKVIDFAQLSLLDQVNIEKEIRAHKCMNHKNVVQLYDFFWIDNHVYLIMEYCMGGDLFGYIRDCSPLNHTEIQRIFKQTVDGMAHIHAKGYINRDIKPENILIDRHGNIKVCDFGWATHKNEDEYRKLNAGTIQYMAPENLLGEYQDFKSDIWSLGILLFELFNGIEPYPGKNSNDQLRLINEGNITYYRRDIPLSAVELIERILQTDKDSRPTLQQIYTSDYLSNYVETQTKTAEKRSASTSSVTISVHCYDKPLHGNYEKDAQSVSLNSRSTSPDQSNSKQVSQKQSRTRTPKKNVPSQLPIKSEKHSKVNLVSLRGLLNRNSISKTILRESQLEPYEELKNDSMAHVGSNLSFELSNNPHDNFFESGDGPSMPKSPKIKKKDCLVFQSTSYGPALKKTTNVLSSSLNKSLNSLNLKGGSRNVSPIKKQGLSPHKPSLSPLKSKTGPVEKKSPSFLPHSPNKATPKTSKPLTPLLNKDKSAPKIMNRDVVPNRPFAKKPSGKTPMSKTETSTVSNNSIVNKSIKVNKISPSPIRKPAKTVGNMDMKSRLNPLRQTFTKRTDDAMKLNESPKPKRTINTARTITKSPVILASTKISPFTKKKVEGASFGMGRNDAKLSNKT